MLTMGEGDVDRERAQRRLGASRTPPSGFVPASRIAVGPRTKNCGTKRDRSASFTSSQQQQQQPPLSYGNDEGNTLHMKRMKKLSTAEDGQGMEPISGPVAMALSNENTYVPSEVPQGYKPWSVLPKSVRDELASNVDAIGEAVARRTIRPTPEAREWKQKQKASITNTVKRPCLPKYADAEPHTHAPIPRDYTGQLGKQQLMEMYKLPLYQEFDAVTKSLVESRLATWWTEKTCQQIAEIFRQRLGLPVHAFALSQTNWMYMTWNLDSDKGRFYGCLILSLEMCLSGEPVEKRGKKAGACVYERGEEGEGEWPAEQNGTDAAAVWDSAKLSGPPIRLFYFSCVCQRQAAAAALEKQ